MILGIILMNFMVLIYAWYYTQTYHQFNYINLCIFIAYSPLSLYHLTLPQSYLNMPRMVAPPPSGEFQVVLSKPFNGESLLLSLFKDEKKRAYANG